jgi:trk system potassium uptake protein TrkA
MAEKNRSFAVIGLGAFGTAVATELARFGNRVLGIDLNERRVAALAEALHEVRIADCTDEAALREAGLEHYDVVVVAVGRDLEASIVATLNAKLIGCGTIWAKAHSRTHHRILVKLGADRVIQPEQEIGQHVAQVLNNPAVRDYVSLGNGFHVVNILVPGELAGRTLAALRLKEKFDLRPLGLMRGTEFLACDRDDVVLKGEDKLLVLGRRPELRRFGDSI